MRKSFRLRIAQPDARVTHAERLQNVALHPLGITVPGNITGDKAQQAGAEVRVVVGFLQAITCHCGNKGQQVFAFVARIRVEGIFGSHVVGYTWQSGSMAREFTQGDIRYGRASKLCIR